jgi:hypothetical protein
MIPRTTLRPYHALPLMAALALSGCDGPAPTDPAAPALLLAPVEASHARHGGELPMRAHASAGLISQILAPDFGPPAFGRSDFDGRCSGPSDFLLSFWLEGQAMHMGHFTGTVEHCTQVQDFLTGEVTTSDGVLVFNAANGDQLWGTYAGTPAPGGGTNEHMTFTGGTGRFASASGGGIGHAVCDRQAGTCVFEFDGTIAFDASDVRR